MPKGQFDAFDESKRFVVARNVSGDLIKSVFVCYQGFTFRPHFVARGVIVKRLERLLAEQEVSGSILALTKCFFSPRVKCCTMEPGIIICMFL